MQMGCSFSTMAEAVAADNAAAVASFEERMHLKRNSAVRGRALIHAVQHKSVHVVQLLLSSGVDVNFQDSKGRTALMHSALSTQMIQLTKTDQKWRQISDLSTAKGLAATWNTQVEAARSQETNRSLITRFLVHHPLVDVNIVDHDGRSVVHFAVISGNCQLLALLLCRHDVNLNVADRNGDSPLMWAAGWGHSIHNGDMDVARMIIDAGASVNGVNWDGFTPLMCAASWGHGRVVKYLIKAEADINAIDKNGNTALMLAAQLGHSSVVNKLIRAGADLSITNKLGFSAIMLAMLDGQPKCAHALLKAGAKLTLTDPRSFAQMMMSVWQSKPGIGDMLAYQRCMLLLSV